MFSPNLCKSCAIVISLILGSCTTNDTDAGMIEGSVLQDTDRDDLGDIGVADITITLTSNTAATVSTVTDSEGGYSFANVVPGTYTIDGSDVINSNADYIPVYTADDSPDGDVGDQLAYTMQSIRTDVEPGEIDTDNNFVVRSDDRATIRGLVALDTNGDFMADRPLRDVTVMLLGAADQSQDVRKTDADGTYSFRDLPAGEYTLLLQDLADLGDNLQYVIDGDSETDGDNGDFDVRGDGQIAVTLQEKEKDRGNDFLLQENPCWDTPLPELILGSWGSGEACIVFAEDGSMQDADHKFPVLVNNTLLNNKVYTITTDNELSITASDDAGIIVATRIYTVTDWDCEEVAGDYETGESWSLVRK